MSQPLVFISYHRDDEAEKNKLLSHLGVLERDGLIDVWNDDRIGAGSDWEQEIQAAINQARVAVLLVTANFLNSNFILGQQIPALLNRRENEGLTVFPIIARACAWKQVKWLAKLVQPKYSRPVWGDGGRHLDEDLASIAEDIAGIISGNKARSVNVTPVAPEVEQKIPVQEKRDFIYDVYISYVDKEPDATWVWETLMPRLEAEKLQVAISGLGKPGVPRLVNIEQAVTQSRRVLLVLSANYLADNTAEFENILGQTAWLDEGSYRVLPVKIAHFEPHQIGERLNILELLDLTHPRLANRNFEAMIQALKDPLPTRR